MVTIKTLKYKDAAKSIISITKIAGSGSIAIDNQIDFGVFKMTADNMVYYCHRNDTVELTFKTKPYLEFLGFKKRFEKIIIKEDSIEFIVNRLPDFRINLI